ncbi:MAG: MFS transporter [Firmicutes bacterium]|nr:MFS transporter [Bacillota bacterium]
MYSLAFGRESRNIVLFCLGKSVSAFGGAVYAFAMGLYILNLTGSGLSFALALALGTVPTVLISPVAGVLTDRLDKKMLVAGTDFISALVLLVLYLLGRSFELHLAMVYTGIFLLAILNAVFVVALDSGKPSLVLYDRLMRLNSLSKVIDSTSAFLGPVCGGILFALMDIEAFILVNALSFLLSALLELFLDFNYNGCSVRPQSGRLLLGAEIKKAATFILKSRTLLQILGVFVSMNFFVGFGVTVPLPYIVNNELGLGSANYGIIKAGLPVGMVLGAAVAPRVMKLLPYMRLLKGGGVVPGHKHDANWGACPDAKHRDQSCGLYGNGDGSVDNYWGISLINVPLIHELQVLVPRDYLGRVLSLGISGAKAILALVLSGTLSTVAPASVMPVAGGALMLLVNTLILGSTDIRRERTPCPGEN